MIPRAKTTSKGGKELRDEIKGTDVLCAESPSLNQLVAY